jgi:hypothetical protein
MNDHKKQPLRNPFTNERVDIDCQMVQLIKAIWKKGIATLFCCQDEFHNGASFGLVFHNEEFEKFIQLMRDSKDVLVKNMFKGMIESTSNKHPSDYYSEICMKAWMPRTEIDNLGKVRICVYIPRFLLDGVVATLRKRSDDKKDK